MGDPMVPRAIMNFTLGDLTELTVLSFIKAGLVGPDKFFKAVDFGEKCGEFMIQNRMIESYSQKTLTTKINDEISIPGHADGFGQLQNGEWILLEVKSAASFGFQNFEKNGPGDYLFQAHCLMMSEECQALNIKKIAYIYLRKDTGNISSQIHDFDYDIAHKVRESFIISNQKELPPRDYDPVEEVVRKKPTGKWKLPWQCGYCEFNKKCYETKKEFANSFGTKKPVFYVERIKEDSEVLGWKRKRVI